MLSMGRVRRIVLAAIIGLSLGLFGGMVAIETFFSDSHDNSVEAAVTGRLC
jgi:hypothetical protein